MSIRKSIDKILEISLVSLMALMTINVLWQVLSRFLGISMSFTDELARYLLIWVGILGAGYVTGKNMHLAIDLLPQRLGDNDPRKGALLNAGIYLLICLFAFFAMVIGGFRLVYVTQTLGQLSPAMDLPISIVYMVVPLSGLVIMYYSLMDLLEELKKR